MSATNSQSPVGATRRPASDTTARMIGRSRSADAGVKAGATRRRRRACSSPSMDRIDCRRPSHVAVGLAARPSGGAATAPNGSAGPAGRRDIAAGGSRSTPCRSGPASGSRPGRPQWPRPAASRPSNPMVSSGWSSLVEVVARADVRRTSLMGVLVGTRVVLQGRVLLGQDGQDQRLGDQVGRRGSDPVGRPGDDHGPAGGQPVHGGLGHVGRRDPHELRQRVAGLRVGQARRPRRTRSPPGPGTAWSR